MSLLRRPARLGVVVAATVALLTAGAGIASAHVSVSSPDATQGGFGKVTFRVPNETDATNTVKIRIRLPTRTPIPSVSVQAVPGWTIATTRTQLEPPVVAADGDKITESVSVVEFDAAKGAGIPPGQFQEFSLAVGPIPKTDSLVFNVVQSYSDGKDVAWIEPTVPGSAEPAHPAPVLSLSGSTAGTTPAADASASADHSGHSPAATSSTAALALFVAILALVVGIAGVVLGVLARRRTVSS